MKKFKVLFLAALLAALTLAACGGVSPAPAGEYSVPAQEERELVISIAQLDDADSVTAGAQPAVQFSLGGYDIPVENGVEQHAQPQVILSPLGGSVVSFQWDGTYQIFGEENLSSYASITTGVVIDNVVYDVVWVEDLGKVMRLHLAPAPAQ